MLLATARVRVIDRHGSWHPVRALVDQGSESSIVSERLTQRLKLPRTSASVSVFGVGGKKTGVSKDRVTLTLQALSGSSSIAVDALVLPRLTIFAGGYNGGVQNWLHLQGLELADPDYRSADPVDILLGADVYGTILCQGLKKGSRHEPNKPRWAGYCRALLVIRLLDIRSTLTNAKLRKTSLAWYVASGNKRRYYVLPSSTPSPSKSAKNISADTTRVQLTADT